MTLWHCHALRSDADRKDFRIALVNAGLAGLPPTTIVTAEIDRLRCEGQMLGARLRRDRAPPRSGVVAIAFSDLHL